MTDKQSFIIQRDGITRCRVDSTGAGAFTNRDAQAIDYDAETTGGAQFPLWTDDNDVIYVGHSATFAWVGFRMHTAGDYGTFTFEYWNGAWVALTPLHDGTLGFEQSGYLAWAIPGDWALQTVNGVSAFWIRASQDSAAPGSIAQAYNLLRNATFKKPIVMQPIHEQEVEVRDVNFVLRNKDVPSLTPTRLIIDATHLALTMAELNLLWDMKEQRRPVFVWDGTFTAANPNFSGDAYYESYEGRIDKMPPRAMSPSKMEPFEYTIELKVDTVKTLADRLGANA